MSLVTSVLMTLRQSWLLEPAWGPRWSKLIHRAEAQSSPKVRARPGTETGVHTPSSWVVEIAGPARRDEKGSSEPRESVLGERQNRTEAQT